ncbi:glycosyltransferase [bacterium]|nr:glycosyltransferase [bacterium]
MITVKGKNSEKHERSNDAASVPQRALRIVVPTPLYGGSLPIARHAAEAFRANGHEVVLLDFEEQFSLFKRCESLSTGPNNSVPLQATVASLLADITAAAAIDARADLVWFTAQSPISRGALRSLRQAGVRSAMWFVEDFRRYDYWKSLVAELDCVFTIQSGEVEGAMREAGARNVVYLPAAANPRIHNANGVAQEQMKRFGAEVSFVGAGYRNRVEFFQRHPIEGLRVWGNDWPANASVHREEDGRRLSAEETALVYRATEINLNLHSTADGAPLSKGNFVNPRTFEIAACGGFQICDTQTPLADLFEVGSEIVAVATEQELLDAIEYYRQRPEQRKLIAHKGHERVMREHTYVQRMKQAASRLTALFPELCNRCERRSRFMDDLILASQSNPEVVRYLEARAEQNCRTFSQLIAEIPVGSRDLTRAEMLLLTLHEFRQWGIEKGVVA